MAFFVLLFSTYNSAQYLLCYLSKEKRKICWFAFMRREENPEYASKPFVIKTSKCKQQFSWYSKHWEEAVVVVVDDEDFLFMCVVLIKQIPSQSKCFIFGAKRCLCVESSWSKIAMESGFFGFQTDWRHSKIWRIKLKNNCMKRYMYIKILLVQPKLIKSVRKCNNRIFIDLCESLLIYINRWTEKLFWLVEATKKKHVKLFENRQFYGLCQTIKSASLVDFAYNFFAWLMAPNDDNIGWIEYNWTD